MSFGRVGAALLLAWGVLGCLPPPAANAPAGATGAGNESPDTPASADDARADFVAAFRQASEHKDLERMLQLYCWDGVDAEMRDTVRGNVQDELRQPVEELQIVEAEPGKHGPTEEGGIRWKPSLPVVAVLKARFAKAAPGSGLSVSEADYTLGMKGGQYRITVPVRD